MSNVARHDFVSAKSDGSDSTLVQPSYWNRGLRFQGGANGNLLIRDTGDDGAGGYGADWSSGLTYAAASGMAFSAGKTLIFGANTLVTGDKLNPVHLSIASQAVGDVLFADSTTTFARLAKDTGSTRYLSNTGASNVPAWAQVSLVTGVTGILPGGNGGSGNAFFSVTGPTTTLRAFTLPDADATILTSNTVVSAAQGGTGQTTYAVGDLLYASGATALSKLAAVAVGRVLVSAGVTTAPAWSVSPSLTSITVTGAASVAAITLPSQSILDASNPPATVFSGSSGTGLVSQRAATLGLANGFAELVRLDSNGLLIHQSYYLGWSSGDFGTGAAVIQPYLSKADINTVQLNGSSGVNTEGLAFGGITSSHVLLSRSSTNLLVRLGDASTYTKIWSAGIRIMVANDPLEFNTRGFFRFPSDGVARLTDTAETSFTLLQLGGGTSSFPALKRSSAALVARLADDSANAAFTASTYAVDAAGALTWAGRSQIKSAADGNVQLGDNAGTAFGLLQFGGTSTSYPALKRSSAALYARLADDSAYADFEGSNLTARSGTVKLGASAISSLVLDAQSVGRLTGAGQSVADAAIIDVSVDTAMSGLLVVTNVTDGTVGVFVMRGTAVTELSDPGSVFTITKDSASSVNVYYDGATTRMKLQNLLGATKTFSLQFLGTAT